MFFDDAKRLLEVNGFESRSPFELLRIWDAVVADMESGYSFCTYEYDNDVSVRRYIEVIFNAESLAIHGEHEDFKRRVTQIDVRLKSLFLDGISRNDRSDWWERGVLRNGGEEYLREIDELYGSH